MTTPPSPVTERLTRILWIPALAAMLLVLGAELWRAVDPTHAETGRLGYPTIGQAIVADDVRGTYAFIRLGDAPDAPIRVHDPVLTGATEVEVPPLLWAAAAGRTRIVSMLLGAGVTATRPLDRLAACVADAAEHADTAALLRQLVPAMIPAGACPPLGPGPVLPAALAASR